MVYKLLYEGWVGTTGGLGWGLCHLSFPILHPPLPPHPHTSRGHHFLPQKEVLSHVVVYFLHLANKETNKLESDAYTAFYPLSWNKSVNKSKLVPPTY